MAFSSSDVILLFDSTALIISGMISGVTPTAIAKASCKSATRSAASSSTGFRWDSSASLL